MLGCGEVRDKTIYIYDADEEAAIKTLKHEFIHHQIHKEVVEPLVKHINLQKALIEDFADRLSKLL